MMRCSRLSVCKPSGIGLEAVGWGDPSRAVGVEDILAHHVALVRLDAMPDARVHEGHSALAQADYPLARDRLVAVVLIDVLLAVAAGQDH